MIQVLAARYYTVHRIDQLRSLARRLAEVGLGMGTLLGGTLILCRHLLPKLFSTNPLVSAKVAKLLVIVGLQVRSPPLKAVTPPLTAPHSPHLKTGTSRLSCRTMLFTLP